MLWMSDATGVGTGGSTNVSETWHALQAIHRYHSAKADLASARQIMTVQGYGESNCLATAERNQTQMTWSVETFQEDIVQCKPSFPLDWSQTVDSGLPPFNMTVISLDQSFDPFDVDFGSNATADWDVNLKAGSDFTIMFNDARGYGTGGTGERYTVNSTATEDTSCLEGGGGNVTITPGVSHTRTSTVTSAPQETITDGTDSGGNTGGGLSE